MFFNRGFFAVHPDAHLPDSGTPVILSTINPNPYYFLNPSISRAPDGADFGVWCLVFGVWYVVCGTEGVAFDVLQPEVLRDVHPYAHLMISRGSESNRGWG